MKIQQTLFLLCLFSLFTLSSCFNNDDEDKITPDKATLLGKWLMTDITYSGTSTTAIPGFDPITADFTGVGSDSDYTIELTERDFTASGGYTATLTTTSLGQTFTQTIVGTNYASSGPWTLNGDQLTISPQGEAPVTMTVKNLSENSFDMSFDLQIVKDEFGGTVTQSVQGSMSFVKQ
ncbi:MAG: lipocalin family protein [Flammeovirgaceae bacterium]